MLGPITKAMLAAGLGLGALATAGCAELEFGDGYDPRGATYYDPAPFLMVSYNKDCEATASLITLPDPAHVRHVRPKTGYGSAELSATFANGMLASFGQKTDTKIPETITAATGLLKQLGVAALVADCKAGKPPKLYRIASQGGAVVLQPVSLPD